MLGAEDRVEVIRCADHVPAGPSHVCEVGAARYAHGAAPTFSLTSWNVLAVGYGH